jgi:predicted neuraminidase
LLIAHKIHGDLDVYKELKATLENYKDQPFPFKEAATNGKYIILKSGNKIKNLIVLASFTENNVIYANNNEKLKSGFYESME